MRIKSYIGTGLFSGCDALTNVTIPSTLTNFALYDLEGAFSGCSNLITAGPIGGKYNIEFGWTEEIPHGAFYDCQSLTKVVIPDGITTIGRSAFSYCDNLSELIIPSSVSNILLDMDMNGDFHSPYASDLLINAGPIGGNYHIQFGWTQEIPENAFYGTAITSIEIPESIVSIGEKALDCYFLETVNIPSTVATIAHNVFSNDGNLETINVLNNNPNFYSIDGVLFDTRANTLVQYPHAKTESSYTIPDGTKRIGEGSFASGYYEGDCYLSNVIIPNSVEVIENGAFRNRDALSNIDIPNSVIMIGESAFEDCDNLKTVTIGNSVISIGGWAFYGCRNLESVNIPDSTSTIGIRAFDGCRFSSISIGRGIKTIEYGAFDDCHELSDVYFNGNESEWGSVEIGDDNNPLTSANLHFNSSGENGVISFYPLQFSRKKHWTKGEIYGKLSETRAGGVSNG